MPIIALNNQEHKQLRVRPPSSFEYLANVHMLPLVIPECGHAGNDYPVVFIKKEETEQFQPVAIFGLAPGENLFVNEGQWQGLYMPAIIQHDPFKLIGDSKNPDQLIIGLDMDSELVQESEGEALFDDAGNETDYLKKRNESLGQYFQQDRLTRTSIAALNDLELLDASDLTVTLMGQDINIAGLYTVNEAKLDELPDEKFNELRKRGLLPLIYAQLLSMNQFHRLARLKTAA